MSGYFLLTSTKAASLLARLNAFLRSTCSYGLSPSTCLVVCTTASLPPLVLTPTWWGARWSLTLSPMAKAISLLTSLLRTPLTAMGLIPPSFFEAAWSQAPQK